MAQGNQPYSLRTYLKEQKYLSSPNTKIKRSYDVMIDSITYMILHKIKPWIPTNSISKVLTNLNDITTSVFNRIINDIEKYIPITHYLEGTTNKIVQGIKNYTSSWDARWITHYSVSSMLIQAVKLILPPVTISWLPTSISKHLPGGVIAITQGNSKCGAQQRFEKDYPWSACIVGAINGMICCAFSSMVHNVMWNNSDSFSQEYFSSNAWYTKMLSAGIAGVLFSSAMCIIESKVHQILGVKDSHSVTTEDRTLVVQKLSATLSENHNYSSEITPVLEARTIKGSTKSCCHSR